MRNGYNGKIIPESNLKKDENESGGFARLVFVVFVLISDKKNGYGFVLKINTGAYGRLQTKKSAEVKKCPVKSM